MRYIAWDAGLSKLVKTGGTVRDNLEAAAENDNPTAIRLLSGPPRPIALRHLWHWHMSLQMGLGEGFNGRGALDWVKFECWCRLMHLELYPAEVQALFLLDMVVRKPELFDDILKRR